jgi:uncharacterized protein (TIGR00730 family)
MKQICVFAGSSVGSEEVYRSAAEELGRTLAERRLGLVYGGARVGLMGVVADTALASGGDVTGVIPSALVAKEVAHNGLADLRVVASMHERKAVMAELADAFIALPGGWGTLDELFEILTWGQLGLHRKPCGVLNVNGYFDGMLAFVEHSIEQGFVRREHGSMILVSSSPGALLDTFATYQAPVLEKWVEARSSSPR